MKTTLLLNTPACILIRSMFICILRWMFALQGGKLRDASILYSMLCKILYLTTCILFCFCYRMFLGRRCSACDDEAQTAWTNLLERITSTVKKKSNDTVLQLKISMG